MIWLIIISALLIAAYTVAVCLNERSIPSSISATFYTLEQKWWFCVTMVATAFLLLPSILEVTPDSYQFTAFLACAGMIATGVAPHFKEGIEKRVHTTGAVLCLVLSQVWVALTCPWILLVWVGYLTYTIVMMIKNWTGYFTGTFLGTKPMFWVEITALVATYVTLFIAI